MTVETFHDHQDVIVVTLLARHLTEDFHIQKLGRELDLLVDAGYNEIILNVRNLDCFANNAMWVLTNLFHRVNQKLGQVRICCAEKNVRENLVAYQDITCITQIDATKEESLRSCGVVTA